MRIYKLIIALLLWAPLLRAQGLDLKESLFMDEQLIDLVDSYKHLSSFDKDSESLSYLGLFVAPNARVWCDFLSSDYYGRYVTVRDYVEFAKDIAHSNVIFSNLRKHDFEYVNQSWHAKVEFDKSIDYEDALGYEFSQSKMIGKDFHLVMDCIWLPKESVFRIEKIESSLPREEYAGELPSGMFRIVKRQDGVDSKLLLDGKPLEYNQDGFAFLPDEGTFSLNDDDMRFTQEVTSGRGRYDVYSFSATPKLFRVRPRLSFLINPVTVKTIYGTQLQPASAGVEAAVDFGVAVKISDSFKYVPYVGIGIAHSWVTLRSVALAGGRNTEYSYLGRDYTFKATEAFTFEDFVVSISPASFEYSFGNGLMASAELGFKLYANMLATDLYSLRFSDPADLNLVHGARNVEELPLSTDKGLDHYSISSFFAKLGADYSIMDSGLVFVRVGIENGMGSYSGTFRNVIYNNPNPRLWYDEDAGFYPVVYRTNNGKVEDIKDHTFKSSIKSVRRRTAGIIEFGFVYKF